MSGRPSGKRSTIFGGVECELSASEGGDEGIKPSSITDGGTDGE